MIHAPAVLFAIAISIIIVVILGFFLYLFGFTPWYNPEGVPGEGGHNPFYSNDWFSSIFPFPKPTPPAFSGCPSGQKVCGAGCIAADLNCCNGQACTNLPLKYHVKVSSYGSGYGTVESIPYREALDFDPLSTVSLTAKKASGSTFDHWEGDCTGTGTCSLYMDEDKEVTAVFIRDIADENTEMAVAVSGFKCEWSVKQDSFGNAQDCVRLTATGTAEGPVGTVVELPVLAWSDDARDCGGWTKSGTYCMRETNQGNEANWKVDSGGEECPLKPEFKSNRTYKASIYSGDSWAPIAEATKSTTCS